MNIHHPKYKEYKAFSAIFNDVLFSALHGFLSEEYLILINNACCFITMHQPLDQVRMAELHACFSEIKFSNIRKLLRCGNHSHKSKTTQAIDNGVYTQQPEYPFYLHPINEEYRYYISGMHFERQCKSNIFPAIPLMS
jgi:hypothetical protein